MKKSFVYTHGCIHDVTGCLTPQEVSAKILADDYEGLKGSTYDEALFDAYNNHGHYLSPEALKNLLQRLPVKERKSRKEKSATALKKRLGI